MRKRDGHADGQIDVGCAQFANGIGDPVEPAFHRIMKRLATDGQADAPVRPLEQRDAKVRLERGNLAANGGLAYPKLCRRLCKAFASTRCFECHKRGQRWYTASDGMGHYTLR